MTKATANIAAILTQQRQREGALLPILHAIQAAEGCIPPRAVPLIATALNLSNAEVDGVISFYHDFRRTPAASTVIKVCRAEACQAAGSRQLEAHVKASLGLDFGESSHDQGVTLDATYCLGNCACGPSISINEQLHARVTPAKFDQLLTNATAAGK